MSQLYSEASRTERLDTTARTDDTSAVSRRLLMIQLRSDVMGETVPCLSLVMVLVSRHLEDTFVV